MKGPLFDGKQTFIMLFTDNERFKVAYPLQVANILSDFCLPPAGSAFVILSDFLLRKLHRKMNNLGGLIFEK